MLTVLRRLFGHDSLLPTLSVDVYDISYFYVSRRYPFVPLMRSDRLAKMSGSMIAALLFLVPLALAQDAPPTMIEQQTELTTAVQDIEPLFAVGPMAAAPPVAGNVQSQAGWTVVCSSEQAPNGCSNVLDNNNSTYWQSGSAGWPHTITVDMKSTMGVSGIAMLPQNSTQGNIAVHELYLSTDGQNWGQPLAYGTWWGDATGEFDGRLNEVRMLKSWVHREDIDYSTRRGTICSTRVILRCSWGKFSQDSGIECLCDAGIQSSTFQSETREMGPNHRHSNRPCWWLG